MTTVLTPSPKSQFLDNNGAPLVGGKVFTYAAGTSTKLATYTDSTGGTPNTNPIILNYRGEASIWTPPNTAYKYILTTPTDTDPPGNPIWTIDNIVSSQLVTLYGGVDTGIANAYVLNFTANFTSYTDGIVIYWIPSHTNTGGSTINVNGLGVVNIVNPDGTALYASELVATQFACIIYSGGSFKLYTFGLLPKINTQSGNYTLALIDAQGIVAAPSSAFADMTWTVPPNSSVGFPTGTSVDFVNNSTANITIAPGAGVTINGYGLSMPTGGTACKLVKVGTDSWQVVTIPYQKLVGSFTGTLTGMTVATTGPINWTLTPAGQVTLSRSGGSGSITGTSNTTAMTLTGMPSILQPKFTTLASGYGIIDSGAASVLGFVASINAAGVVNFSIAANPPANFTAAGTKGLSGGWQLTYQLV